jgi:glycosyltransferase involved in cell wall biosynthesis
LDFSFWFLYHNLKSSVGWCCAGLVKRLLRILHIVPALFARGGIIGGAERYALELARHMAQVTPTRLVTFGDRDRTETIGELEICVIGSPWYIRGQRTNPVSWSLFPELLRADVIHCHQKHVLTSSLAAIFSRLSGRRVFVSDLGGGGWDISAYLSTDRWYHGHLHISEYSRRCFGHETNPNAHVILGGVDFKKFSPDDLVKRERVVLFVGRILPHKGINDLIAAMPKELTLEIIGPQSDSRFLADLHKFAAGKNVCFRHGCNDDALLKAYRRAMCVVCRAFTVPCMVRRHGCLNCWGRPCLREWRAVLLFYALT